MLVMKFYSPLEQFKIVTFYPVTVFGYDFDITVTNATLFTLLVLFFVYMLFVYCVRDARLVPGPYQRLSELLYMLVNDLVKQQSGLRGLKFFPVLFICFFKILFLNLLGLTPFGFTGTSQASYTFTLGFSMFIGIVFIAIQVQRYNFVKLFVPEASGFIVPLLIVIEMFSYCIRPISLSVRLFANMFAGHTLLHIISGFAVSLFSVDTFIGVFLIAPILIVCILEFGIAFLQAYVFVVLVSIYLKESGYGAGH
jgi:ATP synthase subunit 6